MQQRSRIVVRTAERRRGPRFGTPGAAIGAWLGGLAAEAKAWCTGRNPWVRLPLLLWGGMVLVGHLRSGDYASRFAGLNFGIHELGHILFMPLGNFLGVAGGTLAELGAPVLSMWMFRRQRDWFAIAFCWMWLGTALHGVGRYVADAQGQALPLLSPFPGEPIHDWNYLLSQLGLLRMDRVLGAGIAWSGNLAIAIFLLAGGWLLWQMRLRPERKPDFIPPWE